MKKVLLVFTILISTLSFGHKFYVSIADLAWDAEHKRIEGSMKLTAHDVEDMLANKFQRKIDLEQEADTSEVGKYLQTYLARNVIVKSDGKQATPNYLGKEITMRGELFIYFTFTNVSNPANIIVTNKVLFELFPKQQNIVHYAYKDQRKSLTLLPLKPDGKIEFE